MLCRGSAGDCKNNSSLSDGCTGKDKHSVTHMSSDLARLPHWYLLGVAESGSGKTLAYGLPLLARASGHVAGKK